MRRRSISAALMTVTVLLTGVGLVTTAAQAAAAVVPPAPRAATGIDAPAAYVPDNSCDTTLRPGTAAVANLLTRTYPGTTAGTVRACTTDGSVSEHYDGRAIDWMTTIRTPVGLDRGNSLVSWLLATDAKGNAFTNARRLGVMYVIWNGKIWAAYRPSDGWRPYSTCAAHPETSWDTTCHRDHVHLSLSWEGAMGRTSYWTGTVPARDYGPCRVADLSWAPGYTTARGTACPSVPVPVVPAGTSTLGRQVITYSGMVLRPGATGSPVATLNQALGVSGSAFGAATTAAVKALQTAWKQPVTGITDVGLWRALLAMYAPTRIPTDFTGDFKSDVLGSYPNGTLYSYGGNGARGWASIAQIGANGWNLFDNLINVKGFSGNGRAAIVGRRKADGALFLWPTNGNGTLAAGRQIGSGWQIFNQLLSPGDFDGDGNADVVARKPDGSLWLFSGNGAAGWKGWRQIATGWQSFKQVLSAGDFSGDKRTDVLAVGADGALWMYPGNGAGGFTARRQIGSGWARFKTVFSAGDFSGDKLPDLFATQTDGALVLFTTNGAAGFTWWGGIGTGWNQLAQVTGVG